MHFITKSVAAVAVCTIGLLSCQNKKYSEAENNMTLSTTDSSSANYYQTDRALIHNANIDVAVASSVKATNQIEEKTVSLKGFILKSELKQNVIKTVRNNISTDSIEQIQYYVNTANLIVRVPDSSLQNFLLHVQQLSSNVQARCIIAEDVSLTISEKQTADKQIATPENNIEANQLNLARINDLVNYSTIAIALTEPEAVAIRRLVNSEASWSTSPTLWQRVKYSTVKGFYYLSNVIVFLLQLWFLIPLYFIGKWGYRKYRFVFATKKLVGIQAFFRKKT